MEGNGLLLLKVSSGFGGASGIIKNLIANSIYVLQTVSLFLIIISSILQYVIQGINYKSDSKRVQHIIKEARLAAWGAKLVPVPGQRKVFSMLA